MSYTSHMGWLLIDWLIDWLVGWSIDWLLDWLTDWLIDWLIDCLIDWLLDWLIDWLIVTTDSVGQFGDPPGSPTQLGGCGLPRAIHQPGWGGDHFTTLRTPIVGNSLKPGSNSSQTSGLHVFPYSELGFHRLFQMCNSNSGFRILTLYPNMSAWPHPAATLLWISTPAAIQQGSWRWVCIRNMETAKLPKWLIILNGLEINTSLENTGNSVGYIYYKIIYIQYMCAYLMVHSCVNLFVLSPPF